MPNILDMIKQGNNNGTLDNLSQLIALTGQQNPVETANIGGHNILVKRKSGPLNALTSLATGYNTGRTLQKRNQFLQGVQQIAQSTDTPDNKINKLVGLMAQHGTDYGLGIKDIVTQYGQQANRNAITSKYTQSENGKLQVPEGFEITGYDQRGQPMIRKIKPNIAQQKFDIAQNEKKDQLQAKTDFIRSEAQDTLNTIAEIEKGMNNFGFAGEYLPKKLVPGTSYYNWKTNLEKLLSKKMIDLMTQMKEASKTGATGFGQLSEKEGQILREASTAIKPGLSSKDAQRYINQMKAPLQKILGEQGAQAKQLDQQTAMSILKQAGGDKNKARQIANQMGYQF